MIGADWNTDVGRINAQTVYFNPLDNTVLDNLLNFEDLGSRLQCDGDDRADVRHRMEIALSAFGSSSHLWADHRLSWATKTRLYRLSVCSSLTHCCEAWTLTRTVTRMANGFNSCCLHVITGEEYRVTANEPAYNLVLAVRKRRLRYLGHVLSMPTDRMVRRSLMALVKVTVSERRCTPYRHWRLTGTSGAPKSHR